MNEETKKPILTSNNIAITTMLIIIISNIAGIAYIAGVLKTNTEHLTQEVSKWDENVISLNKEIYSLQHKN